MLRLKIESFEKKDLLLELINEFLSPGEYELVEDKEDLIINAKGSRDVDEIKREIFKVLGKLKGETPGWGILTGVRPVKLAGELLRQEGSREKAAEILRDKYLLSEEKIDLIQDIYHRQIASLGYPPENSAGVYIGIPFCPTRCLYCSFASNQVGEKEIARYLQALKKEILWTGRKMDEWGIHTESLYMGGGTPTTLSAEQLGEIITSIKESFDMSWVKEFTVEAGRPDTIDLEKLRTLKDLGVDRISINPQSMKDRTLELIGRNRSPRDIERAFGEALEVGFNSINADLIAGLPEEEPEDLMNSLIRVRELGADNITIHSLAVKRASKLKEVDPDYHYKQGETVKEMIRGAGEYLDGEGFRPYYLYRQKHMAGAAENTGYAIPGKESIYNVRIMDEHQHIIALGAGGVSKVYYTKENRLERVANVTNYEQYIDRIDEMLERKEKGFSQED